MTPDELQVIANLLGIKPGVVPALLGVLVDGRASAGQDDELASAVAAVRAAEARIRATFICHRPASWQVVVGHHDHHRAPGMITLAIGDRVRLMCAHSYLLVPVEVTGLPATPQDYHRGIIVDVEQTTMRYRVGDGVQFSEDQAVLSGQQRRHARRSVGAV